MHTPKIFSKPGGSLKKGPFCWQNKGILRRIREGFDSRHTVASALGTYLALSEVASDSQSDTFQTTHSWLAMKSGLSPRTIDDRVKELAALGIITVMTPPLKAPSTYTLLRETQPLRDEAQPLPNDPQLRVQDTLRSLEKSLEESHEQSPKKNASLIFPDSLSSELFKSKFSEWMAYRRRLKRSGDWTALFNRQLIALSKYPEAEAISRLDRAMTNGWTGFEFSNETSKPAAQQISKRNYSSL